MPPVLGPVSPSPMRLWSCAGTSGATCLPSVRQRKLISSPSRNSSITTCCSAAPSSAPGTGRARLRGRVARGADDDALARGQAVGLDHDGRVKVARSPFPVRRRWCRRRSWRWECCGAAGTAWRSPCWFRAWPPRCVGPKTRSRAALKASTMPSERGSSGPTMVRPGCSASARRTMAVQSLRSTGTQRAIWAMPPLPGAQTTSETRWLRADCPGQRMLAAAGTQDQDFHG